MSRNGKLPDGWKVCSLAELAAKQPNAIVDGPFGSNLKVCDYVDAGIPVLQGGNVTGNSFNLNGIRFLAQVKANELIRSSARVGDLLVVKIGSVGYSAIIDDLHRYTHAIIPANLLKATFDTRIASTTYIHHYLTSCTGRKELTDAASQTAQPALTLSAFRALKIPFPPLPEQRKIAEILGSVDENIEKTQALIAKLQDLKKATMQELLTKGIGHTKFKDSPVGRIPEEWEVRTVADLFDMQLGKMLSKAAKTGVCAFPYLGNRNIQWDYVDVSDLEWMDFNDRETRKFALIPGDLLVCEGGDVGRTALWREEKANCYYQKAIHRLRPKNLRIRPEYMLRYMRWAAIKGIVAEFSTRTSIYHLTGEMFAQMPVKVPTTEEQDRMIAVFNSLDCAILNRQSFLKRLRNLKKALMQDLLTGKVRVKV